MRRSSLRRLRPLAFITCWFPLLVSTEQQHVYTDSFPTNDEYDFSILDAYNIYGSPYGGFGRATRSRLAALPLRLPGVVGEFAGEEDDVYLEVRDADGRLFACRIYHEDQLDRSSLTVSMFNTAKAKDPNAAEAVMSKNSDEVKVVEPETMTFSENEAAGSVKTNENVEKQAPTKNLVNFIAMDKVLSMLKGVCTQIHMGWWSYEWCHEQGVAQFHIYVSEKDGDKLRLDDVTSLGKYESRKIDMFDTENQANINFDDNSLSITMNIHLDGGEESEKPKGLGVIIDEFENGDFCEETQLPRRTTVKLMCCSLETMSKFKSGIVYKGNLVKSNIAAIQRMKETEVCNYYLEVCTPLLCEGLTEAFEDGLFAEEIPSKEKTENKPVSRAPREKKEGESIREILGSTLLNTCLRFFDGGWWVYEVCHGRHVRQYHDADKFDSATGSHSRVPESVHMLGYYSKDDLEGFPNEEEILHVTNPSSDEDIGTSKKNAAMKDSGGAFFEQEYTGGDLCDHSDVTDAAVVAGNVGEGGIERATTVRYFCGEDFFITRVNEDSTCHYIVHITIPDLCEHPLFKTPVVKKQVVKCLPVDESSGISIT